MESNEYITVVIPVFNSEISLEKLYQRLCPVLESISKDYSIILVDDSSTDNSYNKICELHALDPRVKAIQLRQNYGQQNALMCGLHFAQGNYIITMDDDIQNPPEEIEKLMSKIIKGYDVVYGIPRQKLHSKYRLLGAVMRDLLFNTLFRIPKNIKVSSFRVLRKDLVESIIQDKTSFVYISAVIFKNKVKVANVQVEHSRREFGLSNYSLSKLAKLFLKICINYGPCFSRFADKSKPQFEIDDLKL